MSLEHKPTIKYIIAYGDNYLKHKKGLA